jgi:phosphatidylglycerophosphate synthase
VCIGLCANWLGDSLDGSLARARRIERPTYGFFVDHATDVIAQALIFLGLGLSPHMRFADACLLLMSYWLAALFSFIRAVAVNEFRISYFGIGPTEIRLGLLLYAFGLIAFGSLTFDTGYGRYSIMDGLAVLIFPAVLTCYAVMTLKEARRLAPLDRPAPRAAREPLPEIAAPIGLALQDPSAAS